MKTICIYHSRDLDGWMSAAIVKKWWLNKGLNVGNHPNNIWDYNSHKRKVNPNITNNNSSNYLIMLAWDYGDKIPDLSEYDKIIMCDVSFPVEEMEKLQENCSINFIWIDHHISVIKENEDYNGLRDPNFAACELTWKYFFPNNEMPEIVRLLGRYDCFGHKGTDEEQKVLEFQYGARQAISNYEEAYNALETNLPDSTFKQISLLVNNMLSNGNSIYKYLCTEAKQTYNKSFDVEFEMGIYSNDKYAEVHHYKFLCVNQERFNPVNFGIDYHKDGYDGFACFWYKDGQWNWSLYNDNGQVDCSQIAKQYGGGGHKGAAGFVCNTEIMLKIIK